MNYDKVLIECVLEACKWNKDRLCSRKKITIDLKDLEGKEHPVCASFEPEE